MHGAPTRPRSLNVTGTTRGGCGEQARPRRSSPGTNARQQARRVGVVSWAWQHAWPAPRASCSGESERGPLATTMMMAMSSPAVCSGQQRAQDSSASSAASAQPSACRWTPAMQRAANQDHDQRQHQRQRQRQRQQGRGPRWDRDRGCFQVTCRKVAAGMRR
jgi:hypothetical protein